MKILNENNVQSLIEKMGFVCETSNNIEDVELNKLMTYIEFLKNEKNEIIKIEKDINPEDVVYSHYYWFWMFKEVYYEKCGRDEGIEQQTFKLLENMSMELQSDMNWEIIEQIEKGCIKV